MVHDSSPFQQRRHPGLTSEERLKEERGRIEAEFDDGTDREEVTCGMETR